MKLDIERTGASIRVSLMDDSAKKPIVKTFSEGEIKSVIQVLETAMNAKVFRFTLEI